MELFEYEGRIFTSEDLDRALRDIGTDDCQTLFIHSDVMFGKPVSGFKRRAYLEELYMIIEGLNVQNIIVPTFTYSFCNHEDYDIENSKSSMGAFSEYVRNQNGRYRTDDPLLSVSVPIHLKNKFAKISAHSLGEGSGMDILHHMKDVKFLFLGADMADCFTYVHYVEKMMDVPYRFDMHFEGNVIDSDGMRHFRKQSIHTVKKGVKLFDKFSHFQKEMERKGYLKIRGFGSSHLACISEQDAYREVKKALEKDINYFLEQPFSEVGTSSEYTYDYTKCRITHC